jgi:peroxiredoxin Q/BCP
MFNELRVQVVGINQDDLDSHETFALNHKFGFPLVSNTERVASHAYGVLLDLFKLKRTLVLVGEDGHIWWRHSELRVFHKDAADLLQIISALNLET